MLRAVRAELIHRGSRTVALLVGIEVAAPIENVGYVLAVARVPIDLSRWSGRHGRVLLRTRSRGAPSAA